MLSLLHKNANENYWIAYYAWVTTMSMSTCKNNQWVNEPLVTNPKHDSFFQNCQFHYLTSIENKSQYLPRGANKHVDTAEFEKA